MLDITVFIDFSSPKYLLKLLGLAGRVWNLFVGIFSLTFYILILFFFSDLFRIRGLYGLQGISRGHLVQPPVQNKGNLD